MVAVVRRTEGHVTILDSPIIHQIIRNFVEVLLIAGTTRTKRRRIDISTSKGAFGLLVVLLGCAIYVFFIFTMAASYPGIALFVVC